MDVFLIQIEDEDTDIPMPLAYATLEGAQKWAAEHHEQAVAQVEDHSGEAPPLNWDYIIPAMWEAKSSCFNEFYIIRRVEVQP